MGQSRSDPFYALAAASCNSPRRDSLCVAGDTDSVRRLTEQLKGADMKTVTTAKIYLGMILTAALALPAAAQTLAPCGQGAAPVCFNGTFQGSDDTSHEPAIVQSMTGTGTLLGQFKSSTTLVVANPAVGGTGTAEWDAANGDSIITAVVGTPQGLQTPPCQVAGAQPGDSFLKISETHIITGGTGRFAGVQGSFIVTLYHDVSTPGTTHGTCGSFSGSITPPGTAR